MLPSEFFTDTGVVRHRVALLEPVDPEAAERYDRFISQGRHGQMAYLERYDEVRRDPRLLLEGARSIVCCAIPYPAPQPGCQVAAYALGDDYHEVIRRRLQSAVEKIRQTYGGETRVCIDTAPLRERYWAERSGLGYVLLNNHLYIPGLGTYFFLAEILSTAELPCDQPAATLSPCLGCGRCLRACPAKALSGDGSCDASRCLSYLTIEYRGDFPESTNLHGRLYGCDICAQACPLNAHRQSDLPILPELQPRPEVAALTSDAALRLDQTAFSALFRNSPIKRTKLAGLRRNANSLLNDSNSIAN